MKATEAVKLIMEARGIRQADMARMLGITKQHVYNRLHQKNLTVKLLVDLLRMCGYKLVVVPASKRLKEDEYEVE